MTSQQTTEKENGKFKFTQIKPNTLFLYPIVNQHDAIAFVSIGKKFQTCLQILI